MRIKNPIEPLTGRQTWMQAQILIAGAGTLSSAGLSQGPQNVAYSELPYLWPPCSLSASGSYQTTELIAGFTAPAEEHSYVPKTPLGRALLELRGKAIRSGMKLMTPDEIHEEVARRRGESTK